LKSFVIGHLPFFICHFGALSSLAFSDVLFFKRTLFTGSAGGTPADLTNTLFQRSKSNVGNVGRRDACAPTEEHARRIDGATKSNRTETKM
jgi:hypothetical protein